MNIVKLIGTNFLLFSTLQAVMQLMITTNAVAQWPHWLGENRDAKTTEHSGWDGQTWRLSEPIWKRQFAEGSSSPLVIDDRLILMGWQETEGQGKETITCVELQTGEPVWEQSYNAPRYGRQSVGDKGLYSGPGATPEYDPETGLLFTMGTDGDLRCWNFRERGKLVWEKNLYEVYRNKRRAEVARGTRRDYGYTSSPVVFGDTVLVEVGSTEQGNLIAFEKATGRTVWESENKDQAGHTGAPALMTVDGVACAAVLTLRNLVVTRLDGANAGKTVGVFPWTTDYANNIPTPAVSGNSVLISTSYNHHAICRVDFSLKDGARKAWETPGVCTSVCTPVIDQGSVYWSWRGVHCLDFETGKLKWKGGRTNEAGSCLLTSDGRLIVWAGRGDLLLVDSARNADSFQLLDSRKLLSSTDAWPCVVVASQRIVCRDRGGTVVVLKIAPELSQ